MTNRPDWLCEIVSESNRTIDTVTKLRRYHQAGVPHYWILDQMDRTLTVYRHTADGYLVVPRATAGERVRAEPFDAIELEVAVLLGDDPAIPTTSEREQESEQESGRCVWRAVVTGWRGVGI